MFVRVLLVSLLALPACSTSLTVAEQSKPLDSSDAGADRDAAPPPVDKPDAVPEVVTICGDALCENRVTNVGGTEVVGYACCVNPQLSICGIVEFGSTCRELDQPGKVDPTCDLPIGAPPGTLPGCCRPDNTCGVFESGLGLGCTVVPIWTAITSCKYE